MNRAWYTFRGEAVAGGAVNEFQFHLLHIFLRKEEGI
jgi:hypothetical protein